MKIYRVSLSEQVEGHRGYEYFSSKRQADEKARAFDYETDGNEAIVETIELKLTKKDVLRVLNQYGSHPDNG
jgi:hypothetical protein